MDKKVNRREFIDPLHYSTMSDTHAAKKPKTTTASPGPPLYSELDLAKLTVDATLLGCNKTQDGICHGQVRYNDTRLFYQMAF